MSFGLVASFVGTRVAVGKVVAVPSIAVALSAKEEDLLDRVAAMTPPAIAPATRRIQTTAAIIFL